MRSLERAFKFLWLDPVYLQFSTVQDVIDHIKDMVERNWEIFKEVRSIAAYEFMVDSKYFRTETNFYASVSARAENIESFLRALERKFSVVLLYTVHAEISTIQEIVDYLQRESAKK